MNNNIIFSDTSIAFSHKSDRALRKSHLLFSAINNQILSKLGTNIVKLAFKVKAPIKGIIRKTIFEQFCGGESIEKCEKTVQLLAKYNIGTILDYAVEGSSGGLNYETTCNEVLRTVERAKGDKNIPFCVFKPTGIASPKLLEKIQLKKNLNPKEEAEYKDSQNRFFRIAEACFTNKVKLFIDSEDSWIQEPIDGIVLELMKKFNKKEPIVFNTYQLYRKGVLQNLQKHFQTAEKEGFFVGAKLVRGAYMEKERERALELHYEDPILPNKVATDENYDNALKFCITNIHRISLCSGSHNENSNLLLTNLIKKSQLNNNDERIYFAQLYGMSDNISFNLAHSGYNVIKYVPYGPVEAVMPYLFRRAEENTAIAGQSSRELDLIKKELKRRKNGQ